MLQQKKKYLFYLPFLAALLLFLFLYSFSFPQGDDFTFVSRGHTLPNIWNYYLYYYNVAGSRMANLFAQLLLLADLSIWKVLTPFVITGISFLLFYCVTGRLTPQEGRLKRDCALACVCAFFPGLIPLGQHLFADTFLWMDGSCNYLYTLLFFLIGFLPFWNALRNRPPIYRLRWACPVFFTLAGLMHEQTAVALFIFSIAALLFLHKDGKQPRYLLVLTGISTAVMIFTFTCPGAYHRLTEVGQGHTGSMVRRLYENLAHYFVPFSADYWPLTAVIGLCALYLLYRHPLRFQRITMLFIGFGTVLAPLSQVLSLPSLQHSGASAGMKATLLLLYWMLFILAILCVFLQAARQDKNYRYLPVLYLTMWASQAIPALLGGAGRPVLPLVGMTLLLVLCVLEEITLTKAVPVQLCTAAVALCALLNTFAPVMSNYASYQDILQQVSAAKARETDVVTFDQRKFNMHYCYFHSFIEPYRYDIRNYYCLPERVRIEFKP